MVERMRCQVVVRKAEMFAGYVYFNDFRVRFQAPVFFLLHFTLVPWTLMIEL